jgi:long-chain acyl-CoA synthetase
MFYKLLYKMAQASKDSFKHMQQILGGRIKTLVSGGSPLSAEVKDFLKLALSCPIGEAYGMTEAPILCHTFMNETKSGTVGGPMPSIKMKLKDCS